jgi:hypothetical protein
MCASSPCFIPVTVRRRGNRRRRRKGDRRGKRRSAWPTSRSCGGGLHCSWCPWGILSCGASSPGSCMAPPTSTLPSSSGCPASSPRLARSDLRSRASISSGNACGILLCRRSQRDAIRRQRRRRVGLSIGLASPRGGQRRPTRVAGRRPRVDPARGADPRRRHRRASAGGRRNSTGSRGAGAWPERPCGRSGTRSGPRPW